MFAFASLGYLNSYKVDTLTYHMIMYMYAKVHYTCLV